MDMQTLLDPFLGEMVWIFTKYGYMNGYLSGEYSYHVWSESFSISFKVEDVIMVDGSNIYLKD